MAQTSYSLDLTIAIPGMLADSGPFDIVSYPAAEDIPPGRAVALKSDGTVELPKTAGAALPSSGAGSIKGVAVYQPARGPGAYAAGEMVPVLRKGRVWAEFTGTLPTDAEALNISHSSTVATNRGKFTDASTSTTAGSEVTAFAKGQALGGDASVAKMDLNLP